MKTSELIKILKRNNCKLLSHGSSHDIWMSNITGAKFSLPRHKSKEIPIGTAKSILKDAGIN